MSAIRQASDTDTGPITPVYALPIDHPSAWKPVDRCDRVIVGFARLSDRRHRDPSSLPAEPAEP